MSLSLRAKGEKSWVPYLVEDLDGILSGNDEKMRDAASDMRYENTAWYAEGEARLSGRSPPALYSVPGSGYADLEESKRLPDPSIHLSVNEQASSVCHSIGKFSLPSPHRSLNADYEVSLWLPAGGLRTMLAVMDGGDGEMIMNLGLLDAFHRRDADKKLHIYIHDENVRMNEFRVIRRFQSRNLNGAGE
jgi:hypothetical protein